MKPITLAVVITFTIMGFAASTTVRPSPAPLSTKPHRINETVFEDPYGKQLVYVLGQHHPIRENTKLQEVDVNYHPYLARTQAHSMDSDWVETNEVRNGVHYYTAYNYKSDTPSGQGLANGAGEMILFMSVLVLFVI